MQTIDYGSVCSGIEAAPLAWHPHGMWAASYAANYKRQMDTFNYSEDINCLCGD